MASGSKGTERWGDVAPARGACYDCGRRAFEAGSTLDDMLICTHCSELVYADELIGPFRALARRVLFRWHSNTGDAQARGWRRR